MTALDHEQDAAAGASRPLRKDAARNRQALIDAGRIVFAERGLDASLDDVAHHAGLGVGTAYRHFANKRELARAIFAEGVERMLALADEAAADPDPWSGLVRFLEGAAEAQCADRGLRETLMGFHDVEIFDRIQDRFTTALESIIDRGRRSGALRDDAAATDVGVIVIMLGTVADVGGDASPQLWRRYLPLLLAGLRPGGPELSEPPIGLDELRHAMVSYKQRGCG